MFSRKISEWRLKPPPQKKPFFIRPCLILYIIICINSILTALIDFNLSHQNDDKSMLKYQYTKNLQIIKMVFE